MKKLLLPVLCMFTCSAVLAQSPAGFTITTINNGIVTKNQQKYQQQIKAIFPQLAQLPFVKNEKDGYTVKIIIDSPQVADVINTTITVPTVVDAKLDAAGNGIGPVTEAQAVEKHQYNITYTQKIMRAVLVDKNGVVVSEKQATQSPIFKAIYTRTFRVREFGIYQLLGTYTPERYYTLFKSNTPPDDFSYKTNVEEVVGALAGI